MRLIALVSLLIGGSVFADELKFVTVPAGEYTRGFHQNDREFRRTHLYSTAQNFKNEQPAHRVKISKGFALSATEVTVGQFREFVEAAGYVTEAEERKGALGYFPEEAEGGRDYTKRFRVDPKITWKSPGFEQNDNHPVTCVSLKDALKFCEWLSKKDGKTYRLPTEAEWEYACRGGGDTFYSWGTDPNLAYTHANVADGSLESAHPKTTSFQRAVKLGKTEGDGAVYTAPVASYKPNAWGFYDMHGNVWEWCQDKYQEDLYARFFDGVPRTERDKVIVDDPKGPDTTEQHEYGDWRVIRGGSWFTAPAYTRSSIRGFAEASDASCYTGFRVVREIEP